MYSPHALPYCRGMLLFPSLFIPILFFCILEYGDTQMKHLYQVAPSPSVPNDPSHLPWMVYAYSPNGFARECPMPRNPIVMGYPLAPGTRAVSFFSLISLLLPFLYFSTTCSNPSRGVGLTGWESQA